MSNAKNVKCKNANADARGTTTNVESESGKHRKSTAAQKQMSNLWCTLMVPAYKSYKY